MRGDAEINVDNESDAATADQEGKTSSGKSGKEKISVACRLPYLTIKENDELPKKYRKARQSKTQRPTVCFVCCWHHVVFFFVFS